MMQSSSQGQFNSDAEPMPYAVTPDSRSSSHSDIISDRLLLEVELAHERQHAESAASERATYASREATISYEEALERELEYQKRMNMSLLHPLVGSGSLSTPSQELPPKPNLAGIKRKLVSGSLPEPALQLVNDRKLLPKQLQDHQASPHRLQFRQPPMQQLQQQKPSLQQSNIRPPLARGQQYRQPLPHLSLNRQHLLHNSQGQERPLWCNLCKVNCINPFNLKNHLQGKKHKAKLEAGHGSKNTAPNENEMVWCKECNVPCMNEISLAQHRAGKKHAAQIQALRAGNGSPGLPGSNGPQ